MVYSCNKVVTSFNIVYSVGSVIITKKHHEVTNFSSFQSIVIGKKEIYLLLHNLKTAGYDRHFHAYNAEATPANEFLNI